MKPIILINGGTGSQGGSFVKKLMRQNELEMRHLTADELANMYRAQRIFVPRRQAGLDENRRMDPSMQSLANWMTRNRFRVMDHLAAKMDLFVI